MKEHITVLFDYDGTLANTSQRSCPTVYTVKKLVNAAAPYTKPKNAKLFYAMLATPLTCDCCSFSESQWLC